MNDLFTILGCWLLAALIATWLWHRHGRGGRAGSIDVLWSLGTALTAAVLAMTASESPLSRRALLAVIVLLWGGRLAIHLARRLTIHGEDPRYEMLLARWGDGKRIRLLLFFQVQAMWVVLFAIPIWLAARNPEPAPALMDFAGAAIALIAIAGEAIADAQLARFRRDPERHRRVCEVGLWRYSRHPNYFFEWVYWLSFPLIGWGGPWRWLTLAAPALMLVFLLRVTGIPLLEALLVERRGDVYREYQRRTSRFIPLPRRKPVA